MRPLQCQLRTRGISLRGNIFHMIKVMQRFFHALVMWKKPWFLSQGPVLGAPCHRITLMMDIFLTGWGAIMSGHSARGLRGDHHLLWHTNCLEMLVLFGVLKHFLPELARGHHVLICTDISGFLRQPTLQTGTPDPGKAALPGADIVLRQRLRPGK